VGGAGSEGATRRRRQQHSEHVGRGTAEGTFNPGRRRQAQAGGLGRRYLTGTGARRKERKQTGKGAVARWVMEFEGAFLCGAQVRHI
jgi:hypothetical protein